MEHESYLCGAVFGPMSLDTSECIKSSMLSKKSTIVFSLVVWTKEPIFGTTSQEVVLRWCHEEQNVFMFLLDFAYICLTDYIGRAELERNSKVMTSLLVSTNMMLLRAILML